MNLALCSADGNVAPSTAAPVYVSDLRARLRETVKGLRNSAGSRSHHGRTPPYRVQRRCSAAVGDAFFSFAYHRFQIQFATQFDGHEEAHFSRHVDGRRAEWSPVYVPRGGPKQSLCGRTNFEFWPCA